VNRSSHEVDADPRLRELRLELGHREYEIELLKETAQAVGSQLDLDRVLQLVADRARELIQAETLLIPVLDGDAENYTYRAGSGRHADEIVGQTLPLDFGVCGWVWRHNRPWWRGVLDELDDTERNRWEREAGTLILVPLRGRAHFLGGLAGIDKVGGGDFTQRDLNLLSLFASQVSIAVENAIAYAELAKAKAEAEAYQRELSHLNRELTHINSELEFLALHDQLTGLPNRSLVQDRLQQALFAAERDRHSVAVMIVDLDGFKEVNDALGHAAGDQLLKQVATRFTAGLRHADTVGRMGGDEFALVLPHIDAENAVQVARSLLAALEADFDIEGTRFSVSASIGMALFPDHGRDAAALLKGADIAMYSAKHMHFGYALFEATAPLPAAGRLSLPGDLRQALANREFELHYQPKVELDSGQIYGVEALARWTHPQRGPVAPEEFVGIMEQTGLIRPFTLWAIEHALQQCAAWRAAGLDLSVAVNLSMQSLLDPRFPEQLLERLGQQCVLPQPRLVLEITESVFLREHAKVRQVLTLLRSHGVLFSIDDFGTGHSSLSRLRKLPVSELKIDRSFVKEMQNNRDDMVIVSSTVDLARNLGLGVIAEGVEDAQTLALLQSMGCRHVQGHYISPPLPAEDFSRFLAGTRWTPRRA